MTKFEIAESFNWMSPDFKLVDSGKNTIRIKGVALKGNVVSRNKRKYVDEELKKAARTWIGKPVTINHDSTRNVGHIVWMEYEDGALEYLADVNKQPYVGLLRDKSTDIRGVSIEANYLHNRCPKCGEKFYSEEEFAEHMWTKHFVRADATKEPHGIVGQALSLVLAPEEPGYPDSTIELAETVGKPGLQLLETVIKTKIEEENYMTKPNKKAVVTPEKHINIDMVKEQAPRTDAERAKSHFNISDEAWEKLSDKEKQDYISSLPERGSAKEQHECPEGEHWSEEENKCVANKAEEQEDHGCAEGEHWDSEKQECVPNKAEEQEDIPKDEHGCIIGEEVWSEAENKCVALSVEEKTRLAPMIDMMKKQYEMLKEQESCPEGEHRNEEGECVPDTVEEQEACPEGEHRDPETGECVPDTVTEQDSTQECPIGFHRDPETGECVPDAATLPEPLPNVVVGEIKLQKPTLKPKLLETLTPKQLRLGEPFADYADFDACVAANQDKEDPEAYCASIKNKAEGETVKLPEVDMTAVVKPILKAHEMEKRNTLRREKALLKKINEIVKAYINLSKIMETYGVSMRENDALLAKRIIEVVKCLNKSDKAVANRIIEAVKRLNKSDKAIIQAFHKTIEETLKKVPKADLSWKSKLAKLTKDHETMNNELEKAKANYTAVMDKADKTHDKNKITLETTVAELEKKGLEITALKAEITKLQEASDKKLKETESLGTRVDNLEEKRKGKFKAHKKQVEETAPKEHVEDPLKKKGD